MTASRGKHTAVGVAALGLLVLGGTGFALRGRLIEQWHIFRLESKDVTVRFRAAARLGEMRSVRALPKLIDVLKEIHGHSKEAREIWGPQWFSSGVPGLFASMGPAAVPVLARALEETSGQRGLPWRRMACKALAATEALEAVPPLIQRVNDADTCVRFTAFGALGSMGPVAKDALPALRERLRDRTDRYANLAERAIERIEGVAETNGTAALATRR